MTNAILSLIAALIIVESNGNPTALGDNTGAVGILQIHPVMIAEANRLAGFERFALRDRWNPMLSKQICFLVLNERRKRAGYTEWTPECRDYCINLWNHGGKYRGRVLEAAKQLSERETLAKRVRGHLLALSDSKGSQRLLKRGNK